MGTISSGLPFTHDDGRPYGAPPAATIVPEEARAAVTVAVSHVGSGASVDDVIRAALKSLRPASAGADQ